MTLGFLRGGPRDFGGALEAGDALGDARLAALGADGSRPSGRSEKPGVERPPARGEPKN